MAFVAELKQADGTIAALLEEVLLLELRVLFGYFERVEEIVVAVAPVTSRGSPPRSRGGKELRHAQRGPAKHKVLRLHLDLVIVESERPSLVITVAYRADDEYEKADVQDDRKHLVAPRDHYLLRIFIDKKIRADHQNELDHNDPEVVATLEHFI